MSSYKRILLKVSGEVLGGEDGVGADAKELMSLAASIADLTSKGLQVAIVVGGGNFWRFRDNADLKIPRTSSDAMGMMATIMNARLLSETLNTMGVKARAMAPHVDDYFAEDYVPANARQSLEAGEVVVCGGGTGNPFFTTDSTAALRALELECDVLMKATKVDGVYDKDPSEHDDAEFFAELSYDEVLKRELGVMDLTAIVLCKENGMPVHVFNMQTEGNLIKAATGENIGTLIS